MSVIVTPAQAQAVADLAEHEGTIVLHQLAHTKDGPDADDLYATPHGTAAGYRIGRDGELTEIGETLPAAV